MTASTFAQRVKGRREELGWSPVRLAGQIDVDPDTIKRWESGLNQPRMHQLVPLADALGVDLRWLLSDEPSGGGRSSPPRGGVSDEEAAALERRRGTPGPRRRRSGPRAAE